MAKFGQQFIQSLLQPSYQQGLFTAAQQLGARPRQIAEQEKLAKQRQFQTGLLSQAAGGQLQPEMLQETLTSAAQLGIDPLQAVKTIQAGQALRPAAYFTRAEMIDLRDTYTPKSIMEANVKRDFSLLDPREDADKATVAAGITEWVNPNRPAEGVQLRTVQDNEGNTFELGTKRKISGTELSVLEKKTKPPVSVTLSEQRETALAKSVGEDVAEETATQIQNASDAMDMRSTIAEAKLVAQDQPDVFGAFAEPLSGSRRATLTLMRAMGVSENDPLMSDFKNKEGSVDQIRSFTQDFVRKRLAATKGAISDKEFTTFIASVPNLLQTPGGYLKLLNQMESINERAIMKGMALREARVSDNAANDINKVERVWDKFSSDFKYSTFMPPEEQRKLWNIYLEKNGKINPRNDISFTVSLAGEDPVQMSYGEIVREAARFNQTVSSYLSSSYSDPNVNISLNPLLNVTVR